MYEPKTETLQDPRITELNIQQIILETQMQQQFIQNIDKQQELERQHYRILKLQN